MAIRIEPKYLKIATININSIKQRKLELIDFVEQNKIDILLIQETWLKGNRFTFPNFNIFRNDRLGRPGGGTMILVKQQYHASESFRTSVCLHIEATFINIKCANQILTLGSVYCSPSVDFNGNCLNNIFETNNPIIIGGDLNAKNRLWGCRGTNRRGTTLYNFSEQLNYHIDPPEEHTHLSTHGLPEILDIFIIKNTNRASQPEVIQDLTSDHLPVFIEYGNPCDRGQGLVTCTKTNWTKFTQLMMKHETLAPINSEHELNAAINTITNNINEAFMLASNTTVEKFKKYGNFSNELKNEIRYKNQIMKRAYRTGDPQIKREANRLTQLIKKKICDLNSARWDARIAKLNIEDNSIFKMSRALTGRSSAKTFSQPILNPDNDQLTNELDEKTNIFANSLKNQFKNNPSINHTKSAQIHRTIEIYKNNFQPTQDIRPVDIEEVANIVYKLNPKKAPGLDNIKNSCLNKLPETTLLDITLITNSIFKLGTFPQCWKRAKIILIPKSGQINKKLTSSYRPISLLSNLGKIIEKIINIRLSEFLTTNNILPHEQFGFRPNLCTVRQTTRLSNNIIKAFNKRHHTGAIFLDISKAFDRVWHEGLIIKMIRIGLSNQLVKIILEYLSNRSFIVAINDHNSQPNAIEAGVPQGSPIAPTLYNIYTHDIPKFNLNNLYLFADDTAITATSKNPRFVVSRLQRNVNSLEKWLADWRIQLNSAKTQAIYFSKTRVKFPESKVLIGNQRIEWSNHIKYLGLIFDKKLTWNANTKAVLAKTNKQYGAIYPLLNKNSKINLRTKTNIYKSLLRPVLTYGAPSWCTASKTHLIKIQRMQNKILKTIANTPRHALNRVLHNDLEIPTINNFFDKIITNYYKRVDASTNPLVSNSYSLSNPRDCYKLPKDWTRH